MPQFPPSVDKLHFGLLCLRVHGDLAYYSLGYSPDATWHLLSKTAVFFLSHCHCLI